MKKKIIELIVNQTNYDTEVANKKLEEKNGDYMAVIREYLNPEKKAPKKKPLTLNQRILTEIRHFCDGNLTN
tara:strand:- start:80 stop:295 length:216 start_codon:yes stop_codon:yes gene_type:complete